jgi:alpha-N-arabinofuranosidase
MANIAQMVNVLQAMILTEGDKMIKTPTYHVFNMYKVHQDAERLAIKQPEDIYEFDGEVLPRLSTTASKNSNGEINISLCHINPHEETTVSLNLQGLSELNHVTGSIITASELNAHNTFEKPHNVRTEAYSNFTQHGTSLELTVPPASVLTLTIS